MFDVMHRYQKRIARSRERLRAAWSRQNDGPVFIISDVNYALCGQSDIPADYFEPAVMFEYQKSKIERHMREIDDDYIPVFHPWYGTAVVPSALGVDVRFQKGLDPTASGIVLGDAADIRKLREPGYQSDGQFPDVLRCLKYFREHTDAPVCVTDTQGPFNIALTLAGAENLFVWMYQEGALVHELMAFCTHVLIQWVQAQKAVLASRRTRALIPTPSSCRRASAAWRSRTTTRAWSAGRSTRNSSCPTMKNCWARFRAGPCISAAPRISSWAASRP